MVAFTCHRKRDFAVFVGFLNSVASYHKIDDIVCKCTGLFCIIFFGLKFINFNVNLRKEFGKFLKIYLEI